jgi:hypothetical protein
VLDLLGGRVHLLLALLGSTTEAEDQVESRLLLDVVVRKSAAILELLAGEDQTLLVRRNAFLVLDLRLDIAVGMLAARQFESRRVGILNRIRGFNCIARISNRSLAELFYNVPSNVIVLPV